MSIRKKIILAFTDPIQNGTGFNIYYEIQINGVQLFYNNGLDALTLSYNNTGDSSPFEIQQEATLSETIDKTLNWLNTHFANTYISYLRVNNTIEVSINSDNANVPVFTTMNTGIAVTVDLFNTDTENTRKLKYFFQYKNIANDDYRFEIYQVGWNGGTTEISGRATISKVPIKEHLEPIRGTEISVDLAADTSLTLQDLYSQNELDFPVKFYRNGKLIFNGYLNPDGVFESFTRDVWVITLGCVDGLGAIDNLSFVKENGLHFVGKLSAQEIVYNCLRRTGIDLKINTSIELFYEGYADVSNENILENIRLNSDRFVKRDKDTIMSCGDVLRSVLNLFNAAITQEDGEWWVYRPNDLMTGYAEFKKYNIENVFIQKLTKNLNKPLGSQIDNFYPHHCNGNQRKQIKGSVSAHRINYKYGFLSGSLPNSELFHSPSLVYPNWTVDPTAISSGILQKDPLDDTGVFCKTTDLGFKQKLITSNPFPLDLGDTIKLTANLISYNPDAGTLFYVKIKIGSFVYKGGLGNGESKWITDTGGDQDAFFLSAGAIDLQIAPIPIAGNLTIELYGVTRIGGPVYTMAKYENVNIIRTIDGNNIVGEFHTVQRSAKISSEVKDTKEIFNGDNNDTLFAGAIFKADGTSLTSLWFRKNYVEAKPILRICAEDVLRINQRPLQIFSGGVYGFIPYLSVVAINNLDGVFMPIEYNYNTFSNIGEIKFLQLLSGDIPDITYKYTFDYGETVKPTIVS